MFEKATRMKLRFDTPQGRLSVEDLWDLPLSAHVGKANLDTIAVQLHRQLQESNLTSFVHKDKTLDETVQLKFDVVKHIIDVRLAEIEKAENVRLARQKKDRILAIIAQKQDEQLAQSSIAELEKLAREL